MWRVSYQSPEPCLGHNNESIRHCFSSSLIGSAQTKSRGLLCNICSTDQRNDSLLEVSIFPAPSSISFLRSHESVGTYSKHHDVSPSIVAQSKIEIPKRDGLQYLFQRLTHRSISVYISA